MHSGNIQRSEGPDEIIGNKQTPVRRVVDRAADGAVRAGVQLSAQGYRQLKLPGYMPMVSQDREVAL